MVTAISWQIFANELPLYRKTAVYRNIIQCYFKKGLEKRKILDVHKLTHLHSGRLHRPTFGYICITKQKTGTDGNHLE